MPLHDFLPGQLGELAHPGSLEGYRLLLEWVFFRLIFIYMSPWHIFISFRREVHPEWNLHFYFSSRSATARSH